MDKTRGTSVHSIVPKVYAGVYRTNPRLRGTSRIFSRTALKSFIINRGIMIDNACHTPRVRMVCSAFHAIKAVSARLVPCE